MCVQSWALKAWKKEEKEKKRRLLCSKTIRSFHSRESISSPLNPQPTTAQKQTSLTIKWKYQWVRKLPLVRKESNIDRQTEQRKLIVAKKNSTDWIIPSSLPPSLPPSFPLSDWKYFPLQHSLTQLRHQHLMEDFWDPASVIFNEITTRFENNDNPLDPPRASVEKNSPDQSADEEIQPRHGDFHPCWSETDISPEKSHQLQSSSDLTNLTDSIEPNELVWP